MAEGGKEATRVGEEVVESSTYLVWIGLTAELLNGKFSLKTLPMAVLFLIPSAGTTLVLLALENRLARRG